VPSPSVLLYSCSALQSIPSTQKLLSLSYITYIIIIYYNLDRYNIFHKTFFPFTLTYFNTQQYIASIDADDTTILQVAELTALQRNKVVSIHNMENEK